MFPAPHPQGGALESSVAPAFVAAVVTNDDSAWNFSADASFNTTVGGSDAFNRPCSTGYTKKQQHLLLVLVRTNETGQTTALPSRHFLWSMIALPALVALAAWYATPYPLLYKSLKYKLLLLPTLLLRPATLRPINPPPPTPVSPPARWFWPVRAPVCHGREDHGRKHPAPSDLPAS